MKNAVSYMWDVTVSTYRMYRNDIKLEPYLIQARNKISPKSRVKIETE